MNHLLHTRRVRDYLQDHLFTEAEELCLAILDEVAADVRPIIHPYWPKKYNNETSVGRNLYVPIEVAQRDLMHRAVLAGDAARAGFQVLIGASWNIGAANFIDLPPGIVLFKSMNAIDAFNISNANQAGHLTAVMSEELFSLSPEPWLYDVEIDAKAIETADLICAQGRPSMEMIKTLYPDANVVVTGTPRATKSGMRYATPRSDSIVVCSMAGTINGLAPFEDYLRMICRTMGKPLRGNFYRRLRGQIMDEFAALPDFLQAASTLKQMYGDRVIVRPHPVEDKTTFGFAADPLPFMQRMESASSVVFVSGCGTGLEAAICGVPALRIGSQKGQGISSGLGVGCDGKGFYEAIAEIDGKPVSPDLGYHFATDTVVEALGALAAHARPGTIDLARIMIEREGQFIPSAFQTNKWPVIPDDMVSRLSGCRAIKCGWNLWSLRA